jgi:hypothetical protein
MYSVKAAFLHINSLRERAVLGAMPGGSTPGALMALGVAITSASSQSLPVETDGLSVWVNELAVIIFGASRGLTAPEGGSSALFNLMGMPSQADSACCEGFLSSSVPEVGSQVGGG